MIRIYIDMRIYQNWIYQSFIRTLCTLHALNAFMEIDIAWGKYTLARAHSRASHHDDKVAKRNA